MKYAVLLDGEWGSGKTYFIKKKFKNDNKYIIYVSLYGITSKDEINKKIYFSILSNNSEKLSSEGQTKSSRLFNIYKSKAKQTGKIVGKATMCISNEIIKKIFNIDLSGLGSIDITTVISLFKEISDYTIVFDDLERCEMPINEVLGYINEYVEHKNVKCVIVANEKEINKINYDKNYELKVLSCLNKNIKYETEENDKKTFPENTSNDKKINVKQIESRVKELYEGNKKYKMIKEKLIGITIKYIPDISKIYDELIKKYEDDSNNLYNFLKGSKDEFVEIMHLNRCNNVRTTIFILDKFEKLYYAINDVNIKKNGDLIIKLVFRNVIFSSIGLKNGININNLLSGAICSENISLNKDLHQNNKNYFTAFDFVNEYVTTSNLDQCKLKDSIEYYFKLNYSALEENDPYKKLEIYWELDDKEIEEALSGILKNTRDKIYSQQLFPKIIYTLSCIENLNFRVESINEIINEMGKIIEESPVEYIDFHVFARDEDVLKIYNKHVDYIKEKIELNSKNKNQREISKIFKSDNWGVELCEYVRKHANEYLKKREFMNEFNVENIIENINRSNSKNIYYFKYCLDVIYNFSNLNEFYSSDIESIDKLIDGLNKLDMSGYGVTKKEAINFLLKVLKDISELLKK